MQFLAIVALAGIAAVEAASSGSVASVPQSSSWPSKPLSASSSWSSKAVSASGSWSKPASSHHKSHHKSSSTSAETWVTGGESPTSTWSTSVETSTSEDYGTWITEWSTVYETVLYCPTDSSTWTFPQTWTETSATTVPTVATSSVKSKWTPASSGYSSAGSAPSGSGHRSGTKSSIRPTGTSTPIPSHCPTTLTPGSYEYPHLIVPVDSSKPSTPFGTSYNGTISPTISSIFNFDIPASDAGKTCSLVFLFPEKKDLETSSYSFNGKGGIIVTELSAPATESTTFDSIPSPKAAPITISNVTPGHSYVVSTHSCGAGERTSFEFSSTGGLDVNFFQDYNPSPLGAYITTC